MHGLNSPLLDLYKVAVNNLADGSPLLEKIDSSFLYLKMLLGFNSADDWRSYFHPGDFDSTQDISTIYGQIKCCPISQRLLKIFMNQDLSLQQITAFNLSLNNRIPCGFKGVLYLPVNLFVMILSNFFVFWFPMVHYKFLLHEGALKSIHVVHEFLSNLCVFEVLYDSFRDEQHFIYSWMQHNWISDDDAGPSLQHHAISDRLAKNVQEALQTSSKELSSFIPTVRLAVKLSKFFYDASEFVHAFRTSQTALNSVRAFVLANPSTEIACIRWEYESLCVMLQSMNAYVMYLEPEHLNILYETAPQVFLRINRLGLSLATDAVAEAELLASLPRRDDNLVLRRGLSTLAFSPGTMAKIIYQSPDASGDLSSYSSSARRTQSEVCSKKCDTGGSGDNLSAKSLNLEQEQEELFEFAVDEVLADGSNEDDDTELMRILPQALTITDVSDDSAPHPSICMAFGLAELGTFYYALCNYRLAFQLAMLALKQINALPCCPRVVVHVLRFACRICVIQRKYSLGMQIIKWLARFTREKYGSHNVLYANILLDYGCLLLNTDNTTKAAEFYRIALAIVADCLPGLSIVVALALEDIAYAYYVLEYTSGEFDFPLICADKAINMLKQLGHQSCIQSASANRVKALILEEMAIDDSNPEAMYVKLMDARNLHLLSLALCERTYGVWNIQTAKHLGNLGRLFQSLENNLTAEEMHLKAIMIKERLLGPNDFEVGLSVGHLASLYNYHMNLFDKAETLYLRSIQISLDLFGPGYSGLEYDYRGLQRVYRKTNNAQKLLEYNRLFDEWMEHRQEHHASEFMQFVESNEPETYEPTPRDDASLEMLVLGFHTEFYAKLGNSTKQGSMEALGRTLTPSLVGEASRSTGL